MWEHNSCVEATTFENDRCEEAIVRRKCPRLLRSMIIETLLCLPFFLRHCNSISARFACGACSGIECMKSQLMFE